MLRFCTEGGHLERGIYRIRFSGFRFSLRAVSLKTGPLVQRLFSTFPEGWPGTGLVFLRVVTTIPLVQFFAGSSATLPVPVIFQFLAAICSALLIIGLWTPIAGLFLAISELSLLLLPISNGSMHLVLAALGAALAMIGPGAWSVDARLFGRKRIRIPQR